MKRTRVEVKENITTVTFTEAEAANVRRFLFSVRKGYGRTTFENDAAELLEGLL